MMWRLGDKKRQRNGPIRTHRRQHRLCYNAVLVLSSALCRVRQIGAEAHHYYVSFSATHLN